MEDSFVLGSVFSYGRDEKGLNLSYTVSFNESHNFVILYYVTGLFIVKR